MSSRRTRNFSGAALNATALLARSIYQVYISGAGRLRWKPTAAAAPANAVPENGRIASEEVAQPRSHSGSVRLLTGALPPCTDAELLSQQRSACAGCQRAISLLASKPAMWVPAQKVASTLYHLRVPVASASGDH